MEPNIASQHMTNSIQCRQNLQIQKQVTTLFKEFEGVTDLKIEPVTVAKVGD